MKNVEKESQEKTATMRDAGQKGSAIVIALFVLILISAFVALALSRTSSEAAAIGNEAAESRTTYAAQGSLEMMTRNFNKIFEVRLNPTENDITGVEESAEPGLSDQFSFQREVDRVSESSTIVLPGGPYAGLYAIRDNWRLRTTATDQSNVQIQLTRNVLNNRVPIFQFGIFYDDDLELFRPPRFSFGGRVHSNRHFFISPGLEGVYFDSRVTAAGHIVTQTWRNGDTRDIANNQTFIKNASGNNVQLLPGKGSVLNTSSSSNNIFASDPDLPPSRINSNWAADSVNFDGNLQSEVDPLKLPIKVGNDANDLIEMVKRGKEIAKPTGGDLWKNLSNNLAPVTDATDDNEIFRAERFANKTGIRVSLADSKAKLPGCASGTGTNAIAGDCGIRLDGLFDGLGSNPLSLSPLPSTANLFKVARGYQPKSMKTTNSGSFSHKPTRVNGERLYTGGSRQVWIKVETVAVDETTGNILTEDITQDFLSLGITEQAPHIQDGSTTKFRITNSGYSDTPPSSSLTATTPQSPSQGTDSRSILKIQRFIIKGPAIPGGGNFLKSYSTSGGYNAVVRYGSVDATKVLAGCTAGCNNENFYANPSNPLGSYNFEVEKYGHLKIATVDGATNKAVVPFPIKMFDTREGTFYDLESLYADDKVVKMGVMSMIDIDVANLRRFLRGDFDGLFPTDTPFAVKNLNVGLRSTDIPNKSGWVLYVSDRRGDDDFDGEFDMEDIYGYGYNSSTSRYYGSDGVRQKGEDVNKNGSLDTDFGNEAPNKYDDESAADYAAITDHKFYRRGVRLVNGTVLPGIYDAATAANTRGFTVSSENGVYVQGNYNATNVVSVPATGNTPHQDYRPFNTPTHIPASIVADTVTILSNNWNDAKSFYSPYDQDNRIATNTVMRFAMISGDTIATLQDSPHQGGLSPRLNGGVHNFKRFLEQWKNPGGGSPQARLDYSGSLINLYYSHNNNGSFKCCNTVYNPPIRNWVFDGTFLDPNRLPPGTPYFQYIQTTGFLKTNQ